MDEQLLGVLGAQGEVDDSSLHLGVLYSSPLGYEDSDKKGKKVFKSLQQLNFQKDLEQIQGAITGSGNRVNYVFQLATSLHFIGHGMKLERMRRL